jgi:uncharacterized protein (TIGR02246 family)
MHEDEQAIRDLIATWMSASKASQHDKVLSLMADDVVFLTPGHPPMRGKSSFAAAQSSLQDFDIDGKSEIQELKILGAWAYAWTSLSVAITPKAGGASIKRSGNTLSIFHKEAGRWVLYRDANMLAMES